MNSEAEQVLEVYRQHLNRWIDHTNLEEGVVPNVTREMFDEWDDPPKVVLDEVVMPGTIMSRRYLVMICSPFHDELGHIILSAIFQPDFADTYWVLDEVLAEVDTEVMSIFHAGKLEGLPPSADQKS